METRQQARQEQFSAQKAEETMAAIAKSPDDLAEHQRILHDLKYAICQEEASQTVKAADGEIIWALAQDMPDFDLQGLYRVRSSLLSLGVAVFLGWLLGGLLATLLGFIGLGGEILRPGAILAALWLEEYLGVNPRARRIMLTVLGLGALGRFAAALAQGLVRLTGAGGIGRFIFGSGPRPNIFKTAWLWFGAIFLYVFFAKKITGLDVTAFKHILETQIFQRCQLAGFFFEETAKTRSGDDEQVTDKKYCQNPQCAVAKTALALLDSLDNDKRKYLAGSLRQAGFSVQEPDLEYIVWDNDVHPDQYEPLGLVKQGDRCKILERPYEAQGVFHKGKVQRVVA